MTRSNCPWCIRAKDLMNNYGIEYEEQVFDTDEERAWFKENIGPTFPQIFDLEGKRIGGYVDLEQYVIYNIL